MLLFRKPWTHRLIISTYQYESVNSQKEQIYHYQDEYECQNQWMNMNIDMNDNMIININGILWIWIEKID